jgi:hypothetical protein
MLDTTYNNTVRNMLDICTEKACVIRHTPRKCNNRTQLINVIQTTGNLI